jgi:hypothetical protein
LLCAICSIDVRATKSRSPQTSALASQLDQSGYATIETKQMATRLAEELAGRTDTPVGLQLTGMFRQKPKVTNFRAPTVVTLFYRPVLRLTWTTTGQ